MLNVSRIISSSITLVVMVPLRGVYDLHAAVKAIAAYIAQPGDDLDWNNTLVILGLTDQN